MDRDPTPGDPARVRQLASRFHDFAETAYKAKRAVESLQGDGAVLTWVGQSGDAFREQFGEFPSQVNKLYNSHLMVADALDDYAPVLETAQAQADRALADGRVAAANLTAVKAALGTAQIDFTGAAQAADKARTETVQPDPDQLKQAVQDADAAKQRVAGAQGKVDAAQGELDIAKQLAEQAKQLRDNAATACQREIDEASDVGIQPRSFWQKLGDALKELWKIICEVAKWVALVAGILGMILGGPLAWIALAAGAILLVKAIVDFSQGKGSVMDLVFAVLGIIPGVKGLTSLSKLSALYKAGGVKEIAKAAMTSMKDLATGMVAAVKNAGAGLTTLVKGFGGDLSAIGSKLGKAGKAGDNSQAPVHFGDWSDDVSDLTKTMESTAVTSAAVTMKSIQRVAGKRQKVDVGIGVSFPGKSGDSARHVKWGDKKSVDNNNYSVTGASTRFKAPWGKGKDPIFVIVHSDADRVALNTADGTGISVDGGTFAQIVHDSEPFQALRAERPSAPIVMLACNFGKKFDVAGSAPAEFTTTLRNLLNDQDLRVFAPTAKVDVARDGAWPVHEGGKFEELVPPAPPAEPGTGS
jgi:uncharacterized protein YukE